MKTNITILAIVMSASTVMADLIVTGGSLGDPQISDTFGTYSGKLAQVKTQIPSHCGSYNANAIPFWTSDVFPEECCLLTLNPGKKPVFKTSQNTVEMTYDPKIELPAWSDKDGTYGSSCPTAVTAWNQFYDLVKAHELAHSDVAKAVFSESHVKTEFGSVQDDEGECVSDDDYNSYANTFHELMQYVIASAWNDMLVQYDNMDASTDITGGVGSTALDSSKDCP